MRKRITPTYRQRRVIEELILQNSTPDGDNEAVRTWNDTWDFGVVARQVDPTFKGYHAAYIANEMGWKVEKAYTPKKDVMDLLAELEERVFELEVRINKMEDIV